MWGIRGASLANRRKLWFVCGQIKARFTFQKGSAGFSVVLTKVVLFYGRVFLSRYPSSEGVDAGAAPYHPYLIVFFSHTQLKAFLHSLDFYKGGGG